MKRKIMIIILIGALLCVSLTPVNLKRAKAASAKKTVTVTLDKVSPIKHIVVHTNAKKKSGNIDWNTYYEKVGIQIKIKIVSMKGKPKKGKISTFYSESNGGKGCLLLDYATKKFKPGIIYNDSNEKWHAGDTYIDLGLEDIKGVSKITYKLTFTSSSGNKILKNVKVKK